MPNPNNPTNFEVVYNGPWKGIDVSMPENFIPKEATPNCQNFIMKNGELRTRPKIYPYIPGPPDNSPISMFDTFIDANNIVHTVAITSTGLWQLNRNWQVALSSRQLGKIWSKVGTYPVQPGSLLPVLSYIFLNKIYWTNGGGNLWVWDGITSIGKLSQWQKATKYYVGNQIQDTNGNWQVCTQAGISQTPGPPGWVATIGTVLIDGTVQWTESGKPLLASGGIQSVAMVDATNGVTAGGLFIGELGSHLILLNTIEQQINGQGQQNFTQRMRWSPSGIPNIWDTNVNIGAGFIDFLEVPDSITGVLFIGSTGLIIRSNGCSEVSINANSGINPFIFNHLWASEHGIGSVYPFSVAQYGPVGIFISQEDIYEYSIGGFKDIAGTAHTAIYNDLAAATSTPVAAIVPKYNLNYLYLQYVLLIPQGNNTKCWRYSIKDKTWQSDTFTNKIFTCRPSNIAIS